MTESTDPADTRPPRRWHRTGWAALAGLVAIAALGASLLAGEATVDRSEPLVASDVERALHLARLHDPRRAMPGVVRTARLTRHETEVLLNHAVARLHSGRWRVELSADRALVRGSLPLARLPGQPWLNVELRIRATSALPRLEAVRIGRLPLPAALVERAALQWAANQGLGIEDDGGVARLHRLRIDGHRLDIVYAWGSDAPSRLVAALLPARERDRLRVFATRLADLTAAAPAQPSWSLAQVMPPLFELARERSGAGEDAALENRAALLVLGLVANGVNLATLLPERREELVARPIRLTLAGRRDFTQHLLISAALAADSGVPLADRIGLFKELVDARRGSGFSFNDLAANRAGVRIGQLAVEDPARLQQRLAGSLDDQDLLPDVSDLPEFLGEREFRRRFGGPGEPAYERQRVDIEERLDQSPLLR